jgi:hypothetical protein
VDSYYELSTRIRYYGHLPESTEVRDGHVFGVLGAEMANPAQWKEPPHERLANLPTHDTRAEGLVLTTKPVSGLADPKAMESFVKRHGVLWGRIRQSTGSFDEDAVRFASAQDLLRRAWTDDSVAIREIEEQVEDALEARPSVRAGGIEVTIENLWSFICVLFLRDYVAGKVKVCANSDCPHPYFLEKRKGQKYCSHPCAVLLNVRRFRKRQAKAKSQPKLRTNQ